MKVLEARSAFLTNYEVAKHLESLTSLQDSMLKKGSYSTALESENLRTVQYELTKYLAEEPCQSITPEILSSLLKQLKDSDLGLTKVEKLMIVNQVPMNEAELSVLLDEYMTRFTEEQREALLTLVTACLGPRHGTQVEMLDDEEQGAEQENGDRFDQSAMDMDG